MTNTDKPAAQCYLPSSAYEMIYERTCASEGCDNVFTVLKPVDKPICLDCKIARLEAEAAEA